MYDKNNDSKINRLKFENILWLIFAIISIMNIYGDNDEIEYLETNDKSYEKKSNEIFKFTLMVTLFIYIYFFLRNLKAYENATVEEKNLYLIKLLGSSLLIAGVLCLIYFQENETSFVGSPAL